ncbi:hypothetical protein [Niameybacter massiliensis]|uniref:hypothetical protein n=1 Tax=Niameybacter massiliensis TaxID=1658108 RepID=UPI0006B63648|nr:hypothetical protein [Niameybacter massiliensis]
MKNKMKTITQSQKMMIFVLSMSLYGLATLLTELIPKFQVGIVEFSVEYFLFIPLVLAMLFDPLSAALGAATGEIVFSEIMLGQFGGVGELEKFLTLTIGIYIAGRMVKDPLNRKMVGIAALTGVIVQQAMGCAVDILKVQFAIESFEAVAGLPESVFFTEGFAFLNDVLFSGILFCFLPTLYLVPRLYRKIEPLLGMKPRDKNTVLGGDKVFSVKVVILSIVGFVGAVLFEFMSEVGINFIDWEAEWAESMGAVGISMLTALIVALLVFNFMKKRAAMNQTEQGSGQID